MPYRHVTTGVAVALTAAAITAMGASSASAAAIAEHMHNTISYTVADDTVCGIPGRSDTSGVENFQVLGDGTAKDQIRLHDVFTSSVTGKSVEASLAYQDATSAGP